MRLTVIGCGYVGLVTGACLAEAGHEVICTDIDAARIAQLKAGQVPIYEEHLDKILASAAKAGTISYTADAGEAIRFGDAIFICVGTPPRQDGSADLSAIDHCAQQIAAQARSPKLVVEKSTVPARTGLELQRALAAYSRGNGGFKVASNPEFLREGTAVEDFFHPDRIVVGVEDPAAAAQLREIYEPILERRFACPVHKDGLCPDGPRAEFLVTTISSAELIKHASNSFLALKISYANAVSDLCEKLGANVEEVTHAMGLDPRIGTQFLKAGLGFGGFCFPKDIQAFISLASTVGVDFEILKAAERVNKHRIDVFLEKVSKALWVVKGKRLAVLGLAFKANTDDIRFAPALEVIRRLLEEGAEIHACDPEALEKAKKQFPQVHYHQDPYQALEGAHAALVCTEWKVYKNLDWERAAKVMARRLVVDGRNLYSPAKMKQLGFEYVSFGRD